jgi:hypothetical protein
MIFGDYNSSLDGGLGDGLGAGIDFSKLGTDIWQSVKELPGDLWKQATQTVEEKAVEAVSPTVQAQVEAKASRVASKGNIALTASIGALAGLLVAGGSWQRRAIGGSVGAILGGLAGLKIGLVSDTTT